MPDEPQNEAQVEAKMAADFYEHLLHRNIDEKAARDMAVAFILGRQRREKREEWERD